MIMEFETQLDNKTIRLPEAIAAQLKDGVSVHVSIRPMNSVDYNTDSASAWDLFLKVAADRQSLQDKSTPYQWKRDDAYGHLK